MAELPDWQPMNGTLPLATDGGGSGRVVVLVATEQAASQGWSANAAVALARGWSDEGRRVILIDGGLEAPTLHGAAGVPNGEGLTDATLYGASVSRVSQPIDDGRFFLISAGTPVADPRTVVRSPRWHRLSGGMTEAGVTLALYVRDGESGTAAFLGSASDIVVLASPGEAPPSAVRDLEPLVRAVTGPADGSTGSMGMSSSGASAPSTEGSRGALTMVLFVILAIVAAAALGFVISSGLG